MEMGMRVGGFLLVSEWVSGWCVKEVMRGCGV